MDLRKFVEKPMTRKRRIRMSLTAGAVLLFILYVPYIFGGYIRWEIFPLMCSFTDLAHCPRCDNLHLHFPLLEWLLLSAPMYWGVVALSRDKTGGARRK
jgi:hypothetical protein